MKKGIAILLALVIASSFCACNIENFGNSNAANMLNATSQTTASPKYETAYPNDVFVSGDNVVTVEKAMADLREIFSAHDCLKYGGEIVFDERTISTPGYTEITYWFNIAVQYEYGNENFRAKVVYYERGAGYGGFVFGLSTRDSDIFQTDSTLTKLGEWTYDDGETQIFVNFVSADNGEYIVEYKVKYLARYWAESEIVEYTSAEEVMLFGDNQWDGDNNYLSIELRDFRNEDGQTKDLGCIKVYPWSGIYWDALHVKGGPFRLSQ